MLCPYLLISINELLISIISFNDINKYGLNVKTAAHTNTQNRHTKQKRFWSFIISTGKHNSGISPLRHKRVVHSNATSKADILAEDYHPLILSCPMCPNVLGPILFLICTYINDLPDEVISSTIRLFADDCILYRRIKTQQDSTLLQHDLNSIAQWELIWQMKFNIDKCYTMQVGRTRHKILNTYTLHDHPLPITDSAKYLGNKYLII